MQDELAGPPITDVHACFTELVEGRGDVARARFGAAVLAAAEALLAEHRALEAAAVPEPASGLRTAAPAVAGLEFDGLAITRLLGRGAMSEVWEARELAAGRLVAVKLLPPELDTAISARLHRETLALASLEHPGIARLYRHGIVRDGGAMRRYIAMELVRGARTLSEWRAEAPRTRAECVRIVAGVADAVAYAHGRGVIHCDLKPGNILVDEAGRAVIVDFGISRLTEADGNPRATVALLGERIAGTLAYIAPESLDARAQTDVRVDVHALGAILYELLAGRPFRELEGLALPQCIAAIARHDPPRLGWADPTLRGDLDRVVARATARDPGLRYPTASQFASDLRAHLAGAPVLPELQSQRERLVRAVARHRVAVAVASLVGVVLVFASVVSLRFAAMSRAEARLANLSAAARAIDGADLLIAGQHLGQLGSDDGTPERGVLERAMAMKGRLIDGGDWYSAAWSPDGKWFVANGHVGVVSVPSPPVLARFDRTERGEFVMRWSIPAGESGIHGCAVSADGATIVDIDEEGMLRLINPDHGAIRTRIEAPPEADSHLAVDVRADGLLAFDRGAVELRTLDAPTRAIASNGVDLGMLRVLAFSAVGPNLLACAGDGGAAILDARTAEPVRRLETPAAFQTAACWNDDGSRLFVAGWDRTLRAYSPSQSAPLWKSHGHRDSIWSVARFDADTIATAGADGTLRIWSAADGAPVATVPIGDDVIWSVAIDPTRSSMLVACRGGLREVELARVRGWAGTAGHRAAIARAAGWSAEPMEDGRVLVRSPDESARVLVPPGDGAADHVALSADARLLAALRRDGTISVLEVADARVRCTTSAFRMQDLHEPNGVTGLCLDAARGRLFVASRTFGCASVDLATGATLWRTLFGRQCTAVAVSPDGRWVFVSDRDGQIGRLDATTGTPQVAVRRQRTRAACLAVSDDSTRLLVGGADGSVRILDARTLEEQFSMQVSPAPLRSIRVTHAGIETIDKAGVRRLR
jgi:WD40 repeat protein/tRNA A-37 threonylcarbamoyl transferase component Bud32